MRSIVVIFLTCLLITVVVDQGSAIKCYKCSDLESPGCGEEYKDGDRYLNDCESHNLDPFKPVTACLKLITKSSDGKRVIRRDCLKINDSCENQKKLGKFIEFCETCEEDKCNGATLPQSFAIGATILVAIYRFL